MHFKHVNYTLCTILIIYVFNYQVIRYLMYERHQELKRRNIKRAKLIKCKPLPRFALGASEDSQ